MRSKVIRGHGEVTLGSDPAAAKERDIVTVTCETKSSIKLRCVMVAEWNSSYRLV